MREILFKAKRSDNGEWVEGYYTYYPLGFDYPKSYRKHCIRDTRTEPGKLYFINKNTLCQYTGLTDKNGSKIWENDVVKCQSIIGRIGWNETHLAYTILASVDGNMQYYYIDESLSSDIEVIGNIFDNPELLKAGEA